MLCAAHGGDLRASIAQFVATQARSTASNFEVADDSDESDESDSDDEPKIRPVYRTTSGRGIRMRAADRACVPGPALPLPCSQHLPSRLLVLGFESSHSFSPARSARCSAALRKLGSAAGGASAIGKDRRPVRPPVARKIPQAVGARFYNDYGETLQLFWDAPGPNPRGAFLQGSILPGATLRMKSYVGHAFHAELAGEMVWGQKLNDKTRQWYTIDRSQKQETTQDLFAGWSLTEDKPAAGGGAAPPPIGGDGGIGPAADMDDGAISLCVRAFAAPI